MIPNARFDMHIYLNIIFNHFYNPNSMKNMFKTLAAVALIALAASCSKDAAEAPTVVDETAKVSFTVELPGIASRATNDGTTAKKLFYAVYEAGEKGKTNGACLFQESTAIALSTTVNLELVADQTYDLVFWAQAEGKAEPVLSTKQIAMAYAAKVAGSDETRDAFIGFVDNLQIKGSANETVTLQRPFAQINVGLTKGQIKAAADAGFKLDKVTVKTKSHNNFNFATGVGNPDDELMAVEFEAASYLAPVSGQNAQGEDLHEITANGATYDWVSFNYVLPYTASAAQPTELVDVEIIFTDENGKTIEVPAFTNVPIERNHRTNIVGDLLTDPAKFEVVILPGFENDDKYGVNNGQTYIKVYNADEFNAAFTNSNYDLIILAEDIVLTESLTRAAADPVLMVKKGMELTIDLNGKKLSSTSTETGKNYNMFDVRGTLTVKNGTMEYEHKGTNMEWNNSTNLFNVTDGGVLNIEGVTAKNLGGSDMAFVAHLNNWGEVTLNVENSTLESTYIAVRVFNSGNDMNNVTIKNSTLNGKYCFWVHNYTVADFGTQEKADAHAALLNFDFWNVANDGAGDSNNTFTFNNSKDAPVLYGFTDAIYFDEFGVEIPQLIPIAEGVAYDPASAVEENGETVYKTIVVTANEGMAWVASNVNNDNDFAGMTIMLDTDVDLTSISFSPIGYNPADKTAAEFKGTFDGQGHTIKGINQQDLAGGYHQSVGLFAKIKDATIKNLKLENIVAAKYGAEAGAVASIATGDCAFEDIEVKSGSIVAYNNDASAILGWGNVGNFTFKNIKIGADVTVHSLWNSYDTSVGGVIGTLKSGSTATFENIVIDCKLDVYNDVCSNYQWGAYRRAGMLIGNMDETQVINGTNYPNPAAAGVTCKNVTVNYGDWMNYHYCEFKSNGHGSYDDEFTWKCSRVEGSDWGSDTIDTTQCNHESFESHNMCLPVDQLFGGGQSVYGLASYPGVTVNYPASYTPEN